MSDLFVKARGFIKRIPEVWVYSSGFVLLTILFYPELFLAKAAPLVSDHWEQHYPWAFFLSESLKNGQIPFWTSLIHCGFPIAAESQIGVFYLPNLILFGLLPFKTAYSWQMLGHFIFSGIGTFLYLKRVRFSAPAAFAGALIFVFGTGYGGAYYNITSLKTISWFPFMLWAFESQLAAPQKRFVFFLFCGVAMSLVAGYMQVAALALFVLGVYALVRFVFIRGDICGGLHFVSIKAFAGLCLSGALGVFYALPQILLTFQLAIHSNRAGIDESFAYAGSMSPLALITLVMPHFQGLFRGNCLYSGILTVFLVMSALFVRDSRKTNFFKLWTIMAVFSLLFAFGQWSPLYVLFIKITHFYSFRTPSKFLIFFNFSVAMLGALGTEQLIRLAKENTEKLNRNVKSVLRIFECSLGSVLLALLAAYGALRFQRQNLEKIGEWLIRETLYGKSGHPHSFEIYLEKLDSILDYALNLFSIQSFWNYWILGICLISAVGLHSFLNRPSKPRLRILFTILLIDLFAFSTADVRSDFQTYAKAEAASSTVKILLKEREAGRLGRLFGYRLASENLPIIPSVNMLYGIPDVGAYSPLVLKSYYETVGTLGNVNDSNLSASPSPDFIADHMLHLKSLGVTHIIASTSLDHPELELLSAISEEHEACWIYRMKNPMREGAYFVEGLLLFDSQKELQTSYWTAGFDPSKQLLLIKNMESIQSAGMLSETSRDMVRQTHIFNKTDAGNSWTFDTQVPGYFVFTEIFYPGWKAFLNGQPVKIEKAYGLFQAVLIPEAGRHEVAFYFSASEGLKEVFVHHDDS